MTLNADNPTIKTAVADVDLRLVDAVWDVQAHSAAGIRPSDRHTIRQGHAAVERLGRRLIMLIGADARMTCRILPLMTQTTRIRETPQRFWLEVMPQNTEASGANAAVAFVEMMPGTVNVGMFAPGFASDAQRTDVWNRFRKHKPKVFRALRQNRTGGGRIGADDIGPRAWAHCTSTPPGFAPAPADLSEVPPDQTDLPSGTAGPVTICVSLKTQEISIDTLAMCLSKSVDVFAPFLNEHDEAKQDYRPAKGALTLVPSAGARNVAN